MQVFNKMYDKISEENKKLLPLEDDKNKENNENNKK